MAWPSCTALSVPSEVIDSAEAPPEIARPCLTRPLLISRLFPYPMDSMPSKHLRSTALRLLLLGRKSRQTILAWSSVTPGGLTAVIVFNLPWRRSKRLTVAVLVSMLVGGVLGSCNPRMTPTCTELPATGAETDSVNPAPLNVQDISLPAWGSLPPTASYVSSPLLCARPTTPLPTTSTDCMQPSPNSVDVSCGANLRRAACFSSRSSVAAVTTAGTFTCTSCPKVTGSKKNVSRPRGWRSPAIRSSSMSSFASRERTPPGTSQSTLVKASTGVAIMIRKYCWKLWCRSKAVGWLAAGATGTIWISVPTCLPENGSLSGLSDLLSCDLVEEILPLIESLIF